MEQNEMEYQNLFTADERKRMIAQTINELRKSKGLSQKEVSAIIGISQATYSAYERGRNEPSAEILVRLSYLFNCPVDILVQRDRTYRTAEDALRDAQQIRTEMDQLAVKLKEKNAENETTEALLELMKKVTDVLTEATQQPGIASELNKPLK